jgi:hypothetical protein
MWYKFERFILSIKQITKTFVNILNVLSNFMKLDELSTY